MPADATFFASVVPSACEVAAAAASPDGACVGVGADASFIANGFSGLAASVLTSDFRPQALRAKARVTTAIEFRMVLVFIFILYRPSGDLG